MREPASPVEALRPASFEYKVACPILKKRADPSDDLLGQAALAKVAQEDVPPHAGKGGLGLQSESNNNVPAPPLVLDLGG